MSINNIPPRLILASGSPRRAELLASLGVDFIISPGEFDETCFIENSGLLNTRKKMGMLVEKIAREKALSAAKQRESPALFLAADTLVILDGIPLGKPSSPKDAEDMLSRLSGKIHHVATGMCLYNVPGGEIRSKHVITEVKFKELSRDEIKEYVATGEPLDKAGAYGIQGKGGLLAEEIHGCYYNVVGLPLPGLYLMLKEFGINLLGKDRQL